MTDRARIVAHVADLIPDANSEDCVLVGIDGVDGSGKTRFADELDAHIEDRSLIRISLDDFHNVREIRYQLGRQSPRGFWLHSYNYERFEQDVLRPLGKGGSRRYRSAAHDLVTDAILHPGSRQADPGAIVVVDGLFLHRDELRDAWDFSIFLEVPFEISIRRMADRDGTDPDPDHASNRRYVGAQEIYFETCDPMDRADLVIDNSDLENPRITRG